MQYLNQFMRQFHFMDSYAYHCVSNTFNELQIKPCFLVPLIPPGLLRADDYA
jgi:hypothetical protein